MFRQIQRRLTEALVAFGVDQGGGGNLSVADVIAPTWELSPADFGRFYGPVQSLAQLFVVGTVPANAVLRSIVSIQAGQHGCFVGPVRNAGANPIRILMNGTTLGIGNVVAPMVQKEDLVLPGEPNVYTGSPPTPAFGIDFATTPYFMPKLTQIDFGTRIAGAIGGELLATGQLWPHVVYVPPTCGFYLYGDVVNNALEVSCRVVEPVTFHGRNI